jgi:hypothetical protein
MFRRNISPPSSEYNSKSRNEAHSARPFFYWLLAWHTLPLWRRKYFPETSGSLQLTRRHNPKYPVLPVLFQLIPGKTLLQYESRNKNFSPIFLCEKNEGVWSSRKALGFVYMYLCCVMVQSCDRNPYFCSALYADIEMHRQCYWSSPFHFESVSLELQLTSILKGSCFVTSEWKERQWEDEYTQPGCKKRESDTKDFQTHETSDF